MRIENLHQETAAPEEETARQRKIRELFRAAEIQAEALSVVDCITEEIENELRFEEDFLFPVIRNKGSRHAQRVVDEALSDHEVIRWLLGRVRRGEEDMRRLLTRLHQEVAHHFREQQDVVRLAKSLRE